MKVSNVCFNKPDDTTLNIVKNSLSQSIVKVTSTKRVDGLLINTKWSKESNCYAYACKSKKPLHINSPNGSSVPGGTKNIPVYPCGSDEYIERLIIGAQMDGLIFLSRNPDEIPSSPPKYYIVALFANEFGFHWLRRDYTNNQWSWKSRNDGPVYFEAFSLKTKKAIKIHDNDLIDMIKRPQNYVSTDIENKRFIAFFAVPKNGLLTST